MSPEPLWQAEDVVRMVRAQCLHEQTWIARGVSVDPWSVTRGDLFVAIDDGRHNGHDHIARAFASGASAALVSRQPLHTPPNVPLIFVDDTIEALRALAHAARERTRSTIVAVTGSIGKSCTADMLRLALGAVAHVQVHPGHRDHRIGPLLALANLPPDVDYAVIELGLHGTSQKGNGPNGTDLHQPGDMAKLVALARPHIGIVTTIEATHLDYFASIEAVADAKADLFRNMATGGFVVLNRDNPHYGRLAAVAKAQGIKKILSFGQDSRADARLIDCAVTREGCAVNTKLSKYTVHYALGAPGKHMVANSLAALLTASAATGNIDACAAALAHYRPLKGRGGRLALTLAPGGILSVIDESAGACPTSVRAAVGILSRAIPTAVGRRLLVLGDMGDLGANAAAYHTALAPVIADAQIDGVFCCGEMAAHLFQALPAPLRAGYAPDSLSLAPLVSMAVRADDIITVKGGPAMAMETIIEVLRGLDISHPRKIAS
jgi:UDP-N-acetylmuramoyl-tripeptide--D-alanyl-D-alanine ligase